MRRRHHHHHTKMRTLKYGLQIGLLVFVVGTLFNLCLLYTRVLHERYKVPAPTKIYRVYTKSIGRLGNHLHNLVGVYGLARTNNRKLVLQPNFHAYITRFLNASYLNFEVAPAPDSVPLKWFRYGTYEPGMEHLEEQDLILGHNVQAIQYFQPYISEINKFLVLRDDLVSATQEFLHSFELPASSTFVSIHVRRGDMLSELEVHNGRLLPKPDFMKKAMTYFLSKYNNVHFIICSDDITWCKHNETYLQPGRLSSIADYGIHFSPGLTPQWDMALLAQCNHSIVTVGTFGWWGAWFAGGEVIYFNHPNVEGSEVDKDFTAEDYFWPTWIGMDDTPVL